MNPTIRRESVDEKAAFEVAVEGAGRHAIDRRQWTGFSECPDCGAEVQPGDGDSDGLCWFCLNGETRDG